MVINLLGLVSIKIYGTNILLVCFVDNVVIKSLCFETNHMKAKDLFGTCFLEIFLRTII